MQTPNERYSSDPAYRRAVDLMEHLIESAQFTPSEMREMAVLASIHYEMHRGRKAFYAAPSKVTDALNTIAAWRSDARDKLGREFRAMYWGEFPIEKDGEA